MTPAPPVGSQTPAQPGADLPLGRAGARRALAGTCSHHRTPTELQDARPCKLQQLTTAGGQEGLVVQELWPSFVPEDAARRKKDSPPLKKKIGIYIVQKETSPQREVGSSCVYVG